MTVSYYLLIGGLINELFARVDALRPFAYAMVRGKPIFGSRTVGLTQFAATLAAAFVLILFSIKVWRIADLRSATRNDKWRAWNGRQITATLRRPVVQVSGGGFVCYILAASIR